MYNRFRLVESLRFMALVRLIMLYQRKISLTHRSSKQNGIQSLELHFLKVTPVQNLQDGLCQSHILYRQSRKEKNK